MASAHGFTVNYSFGSLTAISDAAGNFVESLRSGCLGVWESGGLGVRRLRFCLASMDVGSGFDERSISKTDLVQFAAGTQNTEDNCRNPDNRNDYNVTSTLFDRGFTGHEHLPYFGLINMNGRVYGPFLARFLSPDPFVQAPDYSQNFNRYSYCVNNPLKYTDPSGEFIFTALLPGVGVFLDAMCWGAVIGGGIGGIRGAMTEGMTFWDGAWRGAVVGAVGGLMAPIGGAGMTFATNLGLGTAQGAITGGLDAALWGNDIGKGMLWGAAAGAVFTTLTSENFSNWTKGKGFYNNENVFNNFKAGKYGIPEGSTWQQEALNHFGFEGTYDPNAPLFQKHGAHPGITDPRTGDIFYHDYPFEGNFDRLALTADHEMIHSTKCTIRKIQWS